LGKTKQKLGDAGVFVRKPWSITEATLADTECCTRLPNLLKTLFSVESYAILLAGEWHMFIALERENGMRSSPCILCVFFRGCPHAFWQVGQCSQ